MAFYYAYAPLPSDPPSSGHPDPRSSSDEQFHHTRLPSPYNARLPPGYAAYAPPTYAETMRSGPDPTSRPEPLAGLWNEPTSRTPLSPIVVLVRSEGGNDDEADVDTASAATLCGVPLGLLFFVGGFFLTP